MEQEHLQAISGPVVTTTRRPKSLKFAQFFKATSPDRSYFCHNGGSGLSADDMLLYAYDQPVFVIDVYTKRLFPGLTACRSLLELQTKKESSEEDILMYKEYQG